MKRVLLGTTALAAAACFSVPASAALDLTEGDEGLQFKVTGFIAFQAGILLSDSGQADSDDKDRDYDFGSGARLQFDLTNTTDSGLEYGGRIRLNNVDPRNDITVDRNYVFVRSAFGEVQLGGTPSVAGDIYLLAQDSAGASLGGGYADGIDGRASDVTGLQNFYSLDLTYQSGLGSADNRIKYYSPTISGFQFGVDYAPTIGGDDYSGPGQRNDLFNNGNLLYQNEVAGLVTYKGDFDGTSVTVTGGVVYADGVVPDGGNGISSTGNLLAAGGGVQVGFGGFLFAATYNYYDTVASHAEQINSVSVSGAYTLGPWIFGLGYVYTTGQQYPITVGGIDGRADLNANNLVSGTVVYNLAPGLNVYVEVTYENQEFDELDPAPGQGFGPGEQVGVEDIDATAFLTGIQLGF
jgi:hypothetical protein